MTFILSKTALTAKKVSVGKTPIRSTALACFSKIPNTERPFFRQWYIRNIDIVKISSVSYAEARQRMQTVRSFYGKKKREVVTIEEYCAYTGMPKSFVRMHVVARLIEHDLLRQVRLMNMDSDLVKQLL